ncbi:efflux RND transporter periplasmic adaptor subunit [Marinobacter sp.]|uniref:efflux RND transporter periplasmic adaptor subunit n=1 Tax=Marinobacter sp. TaxID=50741 RepID=UPI0019B6E818|nr:efflux RND transporter periplasmic adaptor subunit [Marinobacter sp.]MBC7191729.1 efflux RND transporter periplasmic adaptor subunit [Marinobacter sp.]
MQTEKSLVAPMFGARILPVWLMVLFLVGCDSSSNQTGGSGSAPPPPEVGVVELQPQRVTLSMELPGRTAAYRIAELRPQVTGILQERLFQQGAEVNAGDVLYRIDPNRYRAANATAQAELERARAELRQAQREWVRTSDLFKKKAVSERQRDEALAALESARANVSRSEAMVETARIELEYTEVKAPISGRTGPTLFTEGALVTANQAQPLARLVQLDPMYVDIQLPVDKLRQIRSSRSKDSEPQTGSDRAELVLLREDGSVYPHRGRVDVTDVTVNQGTSSVSLRGVFPNPDEDLLPGMYVRVRLTEGVRENAILAPQQGVTRNPQGGATAMLVNSEDKVVNRQLETNRAIGAFWLVEKGLEPGDRLIVSGLQKVSPGAKVKPVPADIPLQPASNGPAGGADSSSASTSGKEGAAG